MSTDFAQAVVRRVVLAYSAVLALCPTMALCLTLLCRLDSRCFSAQVGQPALVRDCCIRAVLAEAHRLGLTPPFPVKKPASLFAVWELVSLLFVEQLLLPLCLGLGWGWFRAVLLRSDPWLRLLGRFADLGFWREISDRGVLGLWGSGAFRVGSSKESVGIFGLA